MACMVRHQDTERKGFEGSCAASKSVVTMFSLSPVDKLPMPRNRCGNECFGQLLLFRMLPTLLCNVFLSADLSNLSQTFAV